MTELVRTIIESPYAGDVERNVTYARLCMRDALRRGEAPYASHLLYTQKGVLNDDIPEERMLGIHAGFAFREVCLRTAVYIDYGVSKGMDYGILHALEHNVPLHYRAFLRGPAAPAVNVTVTRGLGVVELRVDSTTPTRAIWCSSGGSFEEALDELRTQHFPEALRG